MKIAIVGTVGIPGRYGGFETLVENLVRYHARTHRTESITVWCSGKDNFNHAARFETADLRFVRLRANGVQSIPYDVISMWQAARSGNERILLLGVSGALALPIIRLISSKARIVTNIDGIEWKRLKWNRLARFVLRASEWAALRYSHEVIADNQAIAEYILETYGSVCHVIEYGGDHARFHDAEVPAYNDLPKSYCFALCRIEPENNVHMILEALRELAIPLVFVGNWNSSPYGRDLRARFGNHRNLHLLDAVYEPGLLYTLRARASVYLHGHSAGGTNPSLVEMMHFGIPILAYDCNFNRNSTEGRAHYFNSSGELAQLLRNLSVDDSARIGSELYEIARRRYTWDRIGEAYFKLLNQA